MPLDWLELLWVIVELLVQSEQLVLLVPVDCQAVLVSRDQMEQMVLRVVRVIGVQPESLDLLELLEILDSLVMLE